MDRPLANSYWVVPGRLLAGEHPAGRGARDTRRRLQQLRAAGIDAFLDLTRLGECVDYRPLLEHDVQYLRSPIADAAIPEEVAQMHAIQTHLREMLAAGRTIYVHCRAGIGRTGTVIGCYLAEQGADPADALQELNRLWQQSARSSSWPMVPQTPEQADFIRRWPQLRVACDAGGATASEDIPEESVSALRGLRQRYLGALLGLAMGDALGAATQYRRAGSFAAVGDLLGGGPFDLPRGAWSDDTALALCLAESLLERDGDDAQDQLQRYARWQREGYLSATGHCLGITAATARTLIGADADAAARLAVADAAPSNEAAPLARTAPLVLFFFADQAAALAQIDASARMFQASRTVRDCCRALGAMLHAALRGEPLQAVLRPSIVLPTVAPFCAAVADELARDPRTPPRPDPEPALTALAVARWALASGGGYRAGALAVVNLGGDADTIGAVYGQIAGALYGHGGIPSLWLASLARRALIEEMADRLLTAALVRLAEPTG